MYRVIVVYKLVTYILVVILSNDLVDQITILVILYILSENRSHSFTIINMINISLSNFSGVIINDHEDISESYFLVKRNVQIWNVIYMYNVFEITFLEIMLKWYIICHHILPVIVHCEFLCNSFLDDRFDKFLHMSSSKYMHTRTHAGMITHSRLQLTQH